MRNSDNYIIINDVVGSIDWYWQVPFLYRATNFISGRRFLIWHTLLVILASAAAHVQVSALFQLFLRETHSSTSILIHASIAVLAQLSALFQQSHRVEANEKIIKVWFLNLFRELHLFILHLVKPKLLSFIWREASFLLVASM